MLSCAICKISKNTYFEEHLRTTASKHRSSFLEVSCKSCCSALINAVMKYSFSTAVVQGWRTLHANLLIIPLHHRYFSKNFTTGAEQQYGNMHLDGCFWGQIFIGNIPAWLLLKDSCKHIHFRISDTYFTFLTLTSVKEEGIFMIFFK